MIIKIENDMKRLITRILLLTVAILAVACNKEPIPSITPEELLKDASKVATTEIDLKGDKADAITDFATATVYRKSDIAGQSWLSAWSGGTMVYDIFYLSIHFQNIERMKIGETLKPSRFSFSFPASSDSGNYTQEYRGKITLAGKGDDYVILEFHNVSCSCTMGDYITNGYLYCTLEDTYTLD